MDQASRELAEEIDRVSKSGIIVVAVTPSTAITETQERGHSLNQVPRERDAVSRWRAA